jgi:hypothetical protein
VLSTILFDPRLTPAAAGLLGALIGVTGTLLVTIVNGLIGRNRYRRDKIWELRQEACNAIVGALRAATPLADRIYEGFAEDEHRYYGSDDLQRDHKRYWDQIAKADEAFKANYLILPPRFRGRYERLTKARGAWEFEAGPDIYLGPMNENRWATRDLMDTSLSSLGIVPWWHRAAIFTRMTSAWIARGRSWSRIRIKRGWRRLSKKRNDDDLNF